MSKMLEETRQQPNALARTLEDALQPLERLRGYFETHRPPLVIVAAGDAAASGGRPWAHPAAEFGRYLIEITTRIPVSFADPSVITLYGCTLDLTGVLVIGISHSGESPEINAVVEDAQSRGAITVAITRNESSRLARTAAHVLAVRAGREETAATPYTGQLLAFYLLAHALGGKIGIGMLRRIPEWVESVLELEDSIAEIAERYTFMSRALTVGRGLNSSNGLELAIKLGATCSVAARSVFPADLLNGSPAEPEQAFPAFVFAPPGVTWPSLSEALDWFKQCKAETLVFTDAGNPGACAKPARLIQIPVCCAAGAESAPQDLYTPIPYIVPAQLFTAHLAWIKGLNPDRPRASHKFTLAL
jgi:glucosamine--fructose-6-phosphate aminotransferase (isomerizing)